MGICRLIGIKYHRTISINVVEEICIIDQRGVIDLKYMFLVIKGTGPLDSGEERMKD